MNEFRKLMETVAPLFADQDMDNTVNTPIGEDDGAESKRIAIADLMDVMEDLMELSQTAKSIIRKNFPDEYRQADSYGALDFGTSRNPNDMTLEKIIQSLEEELGGDEGEW
jgi:hypothetical protein